MLIIDKADDIRTLRNIGATKKQIRRIFTIEGWMITMIGCLIGIALASILCILQQHFGFITTASGDGITDMAYPVQLEAMDLFIIFGTLALMGLVAAYYPARQIMRKNQ